MSRRDERRPGPPAAGDVPNEDEVAEEFPHGSDEPLMDQRDRFDAEGADIRQYTGEPVETEHGTVTPQQMVVGAQRVVGGGEFPVDEGEFAHDDAHDEHDAAGDGPGERNADEQNGAGR